MTEKQREKNRLAQERHRIKLKKLKLIRSEVKALAEDWPKIRTIEKKSQEKAKNDN